MSVPNGGGGETTVTFKPEATFKYGYNSYNSYNISGTITVSYNGGSTTFVVNSGKANGNLTLPSSVTTVSLSYRSSRTTYRKEGVSVSTLRSSGTIVLN